jgi:hypothetical protein
MPPPTKANKAPPPAKAPRPPGIPPEVARRWICWAKRRNWSPFGALILAWSTNQVDIWAKEGLEHDLKRSSESCEGVRTKQARQRWARVCRGASPFQANGMQHHYYKRLLASTRIPASTLYHCLH